MRRPVPHGPPGSDEPLRDELAAERTGPGLLRMLPHEDVLLGLLEIEQTRSTSRSREAFPADTQSVTECPSPPVDARG